MDKSTQPKGNKLIPHEEPAESSAVLPENKECQHKRWRVGFKSPMSINPAKPPEIIFVIACRDCPELLHSVSQNEMASVLTKYCMGRKFTLEGMPDEKKGEGKK